ncbi:MAG: phosphatidate cytidylyltransferase [Oscillospiraceae bacterium]|jgi:phosphatidate cytidylyltransferase|nr:phosphatidate cytidylyltransferase [Oscillospiraceae bacterium]
MKSRIIVAVICVPALFAALVLAPDWATLAVAAAVCAVVAWEFMATSPYRGTKGFYLWTILAIAVSAVINVGAYNYWRGIRPSVLVMLYALFAFAFLVYLVNVRIAFVQGKRTTIPVSQFFTISGIGIPLMLASLVSLRVAPQGYGEYLVLAPVICAFVTDGAAYFCGLAFGKHRPFTHVSPKKSVEGFIGGLVTGTLSLVAYGLVLRALGLNARLVPLAAAGLFGAAATEAGDLAFSLIKRERGIKDFGNLLPGHGGMLDRFDSMVFCAPVVYGISLLLPVIAAPVLP